MEKWMPILDGISYIPASVSPLSAEVIRICGVAYTWFFDVGASEQALELIQQEQGKTAVVISHFHPDHMANLASLEPSLLYLGKYTFEKVGKGLIVDQQQTIEDGRRFRLFPIPSSHAKGCIGLEIDDACVLLGDGVYSTVKANRPCYNATLLKDTIQCLSSLKAPCFLLSHAEPILQKREDVLTMLENIYAQRCANCPDIFPR